MSLVCLYGKRIDKSNHQSSEFVENTSKIIDVYQKLPEKTLVIIGVSYALLDLAIKNVDLKNSIVIETGGMKGKREELTKEESLKTQARIKYKSYLFEYGMNYFQSYSTNQLFYSPNWKKILI